jgi:hypothetical protein
MVCYEVSLVQVIKSVCQRLGDNTIVINCRGKNLLGILTPGDYLSDAVMLAKVLSDTQYGAST